jgi:CspA family cold shock protein
VPIGRVKWFSDIKGFGFVNSTEEPETDIFVHFSSIAQDGFRSLHEGQEVNFEVKQGPKGLYADEVRKV